MGKKYYVKPSCEVITLSDGIRILVPSFGGNAGAADDGGVVGGEAKSIDMEMYEYDKMYKTETSWDNDDWKI